MQVDQKIEYKKLYTKLTSPGKHWVGDGFPVQSLLYYGHLGSMISPFLLLDYAQKVEFPPTHKRLGVGEHPHRGIETVTIVYDGEVEHRDSHNGGGKIGKGDVQWMSAASGLVHEEFHGSDFAKSGGAFEMVQLWVNLPAKYKMSEPGYQALLSAEFPQVALQSQASLRLIAGEYAGHKGPAKTYSPLQVLDLRLDRAENLDFDIPAGYNCLLVVLEGSVTLASGEVINACEVGVFEPGGNGIRIQKAENTKALLLTGEPIREPIVGHGPFVMNSEAEIRQAMMDYQNGKMGHLSPA